MKAGVAQNTARTTTEFFSEQVHCRSREMAATSFVKQNQRTIDWLLDKSQPSVRYHTMVDILGRGNADPDVKSSYTQIGRKGWAHDILSTQKPGGFWEARAPGEPTERTPLRWIDSFFRPKYTATNWRALVLSDLGLTSEDRRVRRTAELFFGYKLEVGTPVNIFNEEVCIVGNAARMLTRFGYDADYRVRKLYDRLTEAQKDDGGWHCFKSDSGTLDSWEPLAAFAVVPKSRRTRGIKHAISRGAEFYLERNLFNEGRGRYAPWFRFHYPVHYYYDILVGLDLMTDLGYADDRRLRPALEVLKRKRRADGTWLMDSVHPDVGRGSGYGIDVKQVKPFALERAGKPSKWITLTALRILKRVDDAT